MNDNITKGRFRPQISPPSATIELDVVQRIEQRDDGPRLVVYAYGKCVGAVPIEPGTEPDLRRAKIRRLPGAND